jgi:hypothetical protein
VGPLPRHCSQCRPSGRTRRPPRRARARRRSIALIQHGSTRQLLSVAGFQVSTDSETHSPVSCHIWQPTVVGRKSREKLLRRVDSKYKARVDAAQAERKGRRVLPTPDAYKRTAQSGGPSAVVEALISRHNVRWANIHKNVADLGVPVTETLHVVFPLDVFLWKTGVRFTEIPVDYGADWSSHLRWGLDSAFQVSRMILCANPVGAAAIARTQLERWSANRSNSNSFVQADGQSTADYYTQIWRGEHPPLAVGTVWTDLSEILHGRGSVLDAVRWEAIELAAPAKIEEARLAISSILTATQLSLRQILNCIAELAQDVGMSPQYARALYLLPLSLPTAGIIRDARRMLWPINFKMVDRNGNPISEYRDSYLQDVALQATGEKAESRHYSERGVRAFASRRLRAAKGAAAAFEAEKQLFGSDFKPEVLYTREFSYIITAETSALLSGWLDGPRSDALATASCAIRAAYMLWLEDDDRAMIPARTVIEQAARLRVWRIKPDKAALLEQRSPQTATRDWLETAGWRRLSVLNRSLGEFSHMSERSKWSGAREALSAIQDSAKDARSAPIQTARGAALNSIVFAFGSELSHLVRLYHEPLAEAFESVLPYAADDNSDDQIESWLQRCWDHRSHSFGDRDFVTREELLARSSADPGADSPEGSS